MTLALWYTTQTGQCATFQSGAVVPGRLTCKTEIDAAAVAVSYGIWPQQAYRCLLQKQCKMELASVCGRLDFMTVEIVFRVTYRFFRPVTRLPWRSTGVTLRKLKHECAPQASSPLFSIQRHPTEVEHAQLTASCALLAKTAQAGCNVETK